MSLLTEDQLNSAMQTTLASMEEGVDYVLASDLLKSLNKERKRLGWSVLDRGYANFRVVGDVLYVRGYEVCSVPDLSAALFSAAVALQTGQIEKLNKDSCDGKVVEIDGKKYQLKEVK